MKTTRTKKTTVITTETHEMWVVRQVPVVTAEASEGAKSDYDTDSLPTPMTDGDIQRQPAGDS